MPIVNENDTVSIDEIENIVKFGDNDKLSAVGLLLEFRRLNSLEYMNIKSQPILNVAQQVLES